MTSVDSILAEELEADLAAEGLIWDNLPDAHDLVQDGPLDSFGFIELVARLESRLGFEIDLTNLGDLLTTVGGLKQALRSG